MKILNIKETVKKILEVNEMARDSDNVLLFAVWAESSNIFKNTTFFDLRWLVISNQLPHFESIRRTRQWLQAKYPELRGEKYNKRKGIEQKEAREDLGYIETPAGAPGTTP